MLTGFVAIFVLYVVARVCTKGILRTIREEKQKENSDG